MLQPGFGHRNGFGAGCGTLDADAAAAAAASWAVAVERSRLGGAVDAGLSGSDEWGSGDAGYKPPKSPADKMRCVLAHVLALDGSVDAYHAPLRPPPVLPNVQKEPSVQGVCSPTLPYMRLADMDADGRNACSTSSAGPGETSERGPCSRLRRTSLVTERPWPALARAHDVFIDCFKELLFGRPTHRRLSNAIGSLLSLFLPHPSMVPECSAEVSMFR